LAFSGSSLRGWRQQPLDKASDARRRPHTKGRTRTMDLDMGLLWIPAGMLFILIFVAALFLTI
jgi:hypothetical protein